MTTSARRQLFRRSKAGCWNCRSKKKKCDELRPHCTRCIRAGESCRYPEAGADSIADGNLPFSGQEYGSPSMSSSASFPTSLSSHAAPMLSRSSSTSGYSQQHSRHGRQTLHHHPYASPSGLSHRDYHNQRTVSYQRPSPPTTPASHPPYHSAPHSSAPTPQNGQQFPPPPLSASAAADWDHTSQQHVFKRARYDEFSSSSSSTSSTHAYPDPRARQAYDAHHRIPSNQSQASSKGKGRDTLPPISPHQAYSAPMAPSNSLPPFNAVSPSGQRQGGSPVPSNFSTNTSPADHTSPVFGNTNRPSSSSSATLESVAPDARVGPLDAYPPHASVPARGSSSSHQGRQKLVLDYNATEPDPEALLPDLYSQSLVTVTQLTKGAKAYFTLLEKIARMGQGQAMAHALAAVIATQQGRLSGRKAINGTSKASASPAPQQTSSPKMDALANAAEAASGASTAIDKSGDLLELANRHHLAAIKALQTQSQPSRRRRFSVIETNPNSGGDDLPVGSNAAVMMLLISACGSAGKSLMLPSYFNQCEQFLADAVEHVSSHRLFPSVSGEDVSTAPDDPPVQAPEELTNHGSLLFLATVVGLYECYLAQYTAVTDWDYNPARLRRLLPFNWTTSDAAVFDATRGSVSETTHSISMVTLELVIEKLDTMRKFKRAEAVAYGKRNSSRREAEDGVAALDSLALREELGLLIRDLEAGTFWKGPIRILDEAEQHLVLDSLEGNASIDTLAQQADEYAERYAKAHVNMPPPASTGDLTGTAHTKSFTSGALFLPLGPGEKKQVNRLRLANHLYRNALLVDLYVTVFNRHPSSLAVRELVSRSIALLGAVPDKLEQGLMWPAIVLGSYANDLPERTRVRDFFKRAQWKGTAGPATAAQIIEHVWHEHVSWRESVSYFGSPYIS